MGRHEPPPGLALRPNLEQARAHADEPRPLEIGVRRARAEDKATILAFATHTWDGWDYIPEAWDAWLTASEGVMLVVEARQPIEVPKGLITAGQAIAMSRVVMLSERDAWLEGIRVDPRVRGRGVATGLQVAELAWARAQGATWIRYATGEENEGSHRLGARHGIRVLSRWRWYAPRRGETEDGPPEPVGPTAVDRHLLAPDAPAGDVGALWALIDADRTFALGERLYESRSWAFQPLTRERFAAHVRAAEVHVSRDRGALVVAPHQAGWNEEQHPHVALVCGDGAAALELLVDLREAFGGQLNVRLPWPDPPILAGDLGERWAAAGFGSWGKHSLHVLGRPLDADPSPEPAHPGLRFLEPPRPIAVPQPIGQPDP
ncbi:MAG TPA: GNAT family N-acetyltransferase [Candidatus Limnocylindrales bacterium]|nr:GNAT family N-acetyltransferase [Candidatus Limnocylindrales bacterium]